MQINVLARPRLYLPVRTVCFIALQRISRFSVQEAIACNCLKNILNRKKGQLYFSIVSCLIKSYHWLVNHV